MRVIDYPHIIGMGDIEWKIFLKLLRNDELTDQEEDRVEQMHRTAVKMTKVRNSRDRMDRQRQRPVRARRPRPERNLADADGADENYEPDLTESGFDVVHQ